jgi:hypothetical protein
MHFKYSQLSDKAKRVAREELMFDSKEIFEEPMTDEEAHEDLIRHDDKNLFDKDGILVSNGGMYAG